MTCSTYERWPEPHDPDSSQLYAFPWALDPGVTIVGTPLVEVRAGDGSSDAPYVPAVGETPLTITDVATGIDDEGVSFVEFRPAGGSPTSTTNADGSVTVTERLYAIRCRVVLSNGDGFDQTGLLRVRQT